MCVCVCQISGVTQRRARLVLRWVTVRGYTFLVCRANSASCPQRDDKWQRQCCLLCTWEGNCGSGVAMALRHRLCDVSSYELMTTTTVMMMTFIVLYYLYAVGNGTVFKKYPLNVGWILIPLL